MSQEAAQLAGTVYGINRSQLEIILVVFSKARVYLLDQNLELFLKKLGMHFRDNLLASICLILNYYYIVRAF